MKRQEPSWNRRVDVKHLSAERLLAMRQEAEECDAHNVKAFGLVLEAFKAYEAAAREYGVSLERVKRNGRSHVPVPVSPDGRLYSRAVESYDRQFREEQDRREKAQAAEAHAREQALAQRKADIDLARLILRYEAPEGIDWPEMLELLRSRDQYLDLAVAGRQTRGNWSEGYWRVADALKRFQIRDQRDKDIAADIAGCLRSGDDGDIDGRIFRDTTWNYDELFKIVADQQLMKDALLCLENVD